jgi:hypothetical protein
MIVVKYELYNSVGNEYFETIDRTNEFIHAVERMGGRAEII